MEPALDSRLKQGGNFPPSEIETLLKDLQRDNAEELKKADTFLANATRAVEAANKGMNDEIAGKITDLSKILTQRIKNLEAAHKAAKEPFWTKGKAIDAFFKDKIGLLAAAKEMIQKPLTAYNLKKHNEAEAARKAAEKKIADDKAEAEKQIEALKQSGQAEAAEEAQTNLQIQELEAQVAPKKPEKVIHRTTSGATSFLKKKVVGKVIDKDKLDLDKLRPYMKVEDLQKALNGYVAAGGRECAGAEIGEEVKSGIR